MFRRSTFFLSQRHGRWEWHWILASLATAAIAGFVGIGALIIALSVLRELGFAWAGKAVDLINSESVEVQTEPALFMSELAMVGAVLWPAAIAGTLVHGRSVKSLLVPLQPFRWSIVVKCLVLQAALAIVGVLVSLPWVEGGVRFAGFRSEHVLLFVPLAALTLFQTSSEDVFFKGFLFRQLGAATALWWLAPVLITGAFVWLHIGNPDLDDLLWLVVPYFVLSELFIVYLIMRTGGMEAALAIHWLNNFFIFLFLAEAATQSNELTLFVFDDDPTTALDDTVGVGGAVVAIGIQFIAFTWQKSPFYLEHHGWKPEPESQPPLQQPAPPSPPPSSPSSIV